MVSARRLTLITVVVVGFVAAGGLVILWLERDKTISIEVSGVARRVPAGITVAQARDRLGLEAHAGDLLDVEGAVLRRGAYPGDVLVGGRAVGPETRLSEGDTLTVVDGRDRREPSTHSFVRVPGGMPSNPQFTLSRTPGRQELARGVISSKVVPLAFEPSGPARTPRAVALTFDDGPSPYTAQVLAVLQRMHARATFFVVGQFVRQYPRLVRRELASGMEVGNHSYSHPYRPPFDRQPHNVIVREIKWGRAVVESLGQAPTLFRPPGGSFSPYVVEAAGSYGQRIVLWSVDPTDWKAGSRAAQIERRVLRAVHAGSIVVLHDGGGDRAQTIKALPGIIRGIREKGLKIVLIDSRRTA